MSRAIELLKKVYGAQMAPDDQKSEIFAKAMEEVAGFLETSGSAEEPNCDAEQEAVDTACDLYESACEAYDEACEVFNQNPTPNNAALKQIAFLDKLSAEAAKESAILQLELCQMGGVSPPD